jgi:transcriptional regulator with XRE-family HTH domain
MPRNWEQLRASSKLLPAELAAIDAKVARDIARMRLPELRRAREMTQATIAQNTGMAQGDISRLERRTDSYVGTLRRYVEALGGTLRIVASFPDAAPIEIQGFGDLASGMDDEAAALRGKKALRKAAR